jgi:murein endopeptidase
VDGQFAGDFYQPRIGGPFRDGHAQERYARAGDALPVGIPATDHGVEKQQPDEVAVATRYLAKVDEQRGREGVPGEHVEAAAEHDRWGVDQAVEQQLCLGRTCSARVVRGVTFLFVSVYRYLLWSSPRRSASAMASSTLVDALVSRPCSSRV